MSKLSSGGVRADGFSKVQPATQQLGERGLMLVEGVNSRLGDGKDEAVRQFRLGNRQVQRGQYETAHQCYTSALGIAPQFTEALLNRAMVNHDNDRLDAAILDYRKVMEMDTTRYEAYYGAGRACIAKDRVIDAIELFTDGLDACPEKLDVFHHARANCHVMLNHKDAALSDYSQVLKHNPRHVEAFNNRGVLLIAMRKPKTAINDLNRVVELDFSNATAYKNRGAARYASGDPKGALKDYAVALALSPEDISIYNNQALAQAALGELETAMHALSRAIMLDPSFPAPYFARGIAYAAQGELERAIEDYTNYIRLRPKDPPVYKNRGISRMDVGDIAGAVEDLEAYLELDAAAKPETRTEVEAFIEKLQDVSFDLPGGRIASQEFTRHFYWGENCYDRGDYDGAVLAFTEALEEDNSSPVAYENRGLALYARGEIEAAIEDFSTAIRLDPIVAPPRYYRGIAYEALGNPEQAMADYNEAISLNARLTSAFAMRGKLRYQLGDFDGTVDDQSAVLENLPDDAEALYYRALAQYEIGDYDTALADITRAAEIDEEYQGLHEPRGLINMALGNLEEALTDFEEALREDPSAHVYTNRAFARTGLADFGGALADFSAALQLDPDDYQIYFQRAQTYRAMDRDEEAADDLQRYLEMGGPDDGKIQEQINALLLDAREAARRRFENFVARGHELLGERDYESAVEYFGEALKIDENATDVYFRRAHALDALGRPVQALADYTQVINRDPSPDAFHNRALAYFAAENYEDALHDLTSALEMDPTFASAYANRGIVHTQIGDFEGALRDYDLALKLDSGNPDVHQNRAFAHESAGNLREAVNDYRRALELGGDQRVIQPRIDHIMEKAAAAKREEQAAAAFRLGENLTRQGQFQKAVESFNQAIELAPTFGDAWVGRGVARGELGDPAGRAEDVMAGIKLGLKFLQAHNMHMMLGSHEFQNGNPRGAMYQLELAYESAPPAEHPPILATRAVLHEQAGNWEGVIADTTLALVDADKRNDVNKAELHMRRGNAQTARGNIDKALEDYKVYLALTKNQETPQREVIQNKARDLRRRAREQEANQYIDRGIQQFQRNDLQGALAQFSQALELYPRSARAYYSRGIVHTNLQDQDAAFKDFSLAIKYDQQHVDAYYSRAMILEARGKNADAVKDFKRFLKLGGGKKMGNEESIRTRIRNLMNGK